MHISLNNSVINIFIRLFSLHSKTLVNSFWIKLRYLLEYLLINFALVFCSVCLIYLTDIDILDSKVGSLEDIKSMLPFVLILGCSILPLIEEAVHRLFISHPNKFILSFVFSFLYYLMLGNYSFFCGVVFIAYFIFLLVIVGTPRFRAKTIFIFIGSAFFFAFFHVFKYVGIYDGNVFYLMVMVIPHFLTGLVLCYVHLKLGFRWGVVHHGMVNLVLVLIIYLLI